MADRLYKSTLPISIFIHALFAFFLFSLAQNISVPQKKEPLWIEVEKSPTESKRQIVQTKTGERSKDAAKDAFLGAETRTVDRETVAKMQEGENRPQAAPQPKQQEKSKSPERSKETPKELAKFGLPMNLQVSPKDQQRAPNWADFSKDYGQAYPDYVKGLKEGEQTALNTKEFVYFSYYKRIRDQLDQAWRPILRDNLYKIFRSGRHLASDQDHVTKTLVTLDKGGDVVKVQVLEESGVHDLDQAAVDAFKKAGPFPNPPGGLVDPQGMITIRWDFVLRS